VHRVLGDSVTGNGKPLTRGQLNEAKCQDPHCSAKHEDEGVFLAPPCHPTAPVAALYLKGAGTVQLICIKCGTATHEIQVASDA